MKVYPVHIVVKDRDIIKCRLRLFGMDNRRPVGSRHSLSQQRTK